MSEGDRDVFYDRFRVVAQRGKDNMNPGSFKRLTGKRYRELYEFKTGQGHRLSCFFDGANCILAIGWTKKNTKSNNADNRMYERALALKGLYERMLKEEQK